LSFSYPEYLPVSLHFLKKSLLENIGESLLNINRARHRQGIDPEGKPWGTAVSPYLGTGIPKRLSGT
jgi:hypothetical protein